MEFSIGDHEYVSGKLNVFDQMKVAARLLPLAGHLSALQRIAAPAGVDADGNPLPVATADLMAALTPLMTAFADLGDDNRDMICKTCLSVVKRREGSGLQAVWNRQAGVMQWADTSLPDMLRMVFYVVQDNIAGFSLGLPRASTATTAAPASTP